MFKLAKPDEIYSYPVTITGPSSGGETAPQEFIAKFKMLPANVVRKNIHDDVKYVASILFGWEGISDSDGQPFKFNDKNRDQLAQIAYFTLGLANAYKEFSLGLPTKNLKKPLDT